jgi:hypothetical protein
VFLFLLFLMWCMMLVRELWGVKNDWHLEEMDHLDFYSSVWMVCLFLVKLDVSTYSWIWRWRKNEKLVLVLYKLWEL